MGNPGNSPPAAREAIDELVDRYAGSIYGLGLRFCGNATDAEDLVQEVFLNAQKGWEGYRRESDPKTWLYTIAARACQRMQRKKAGEPRRVASLDADLPFGERLIAAVVTEQDPVVQEQIRLEARARIERAIAELPEDFRVPLVLKEIVGFTVPQVAGMLGLEEGTVKSRVHRARLKLREAVDAVLPRNPEPAPPPAYEQRVCLDLLNAKQEALDRGVEFNAALICDRCRSVFASLDLTQQVCHDLAGGKLPAGVRERLRGAMGA
jgi:RNA polymerase sigma-70 factor, ECF subfamily